MPAAAIPVTKTSDEKTGVLGEHKTAKWRFTKASILPLLPVRRLAKWFRRGTIKSLRGCELPYKRKQGRFYG
jgi:hypothetical protein